VRALGARLLCHRCRKDPEAVAAAPPVENPNRGNSVPVPTAAPPAPAPTAAPPGSLAKLRVLAARAAAGEALWHPADCPEGEPDVPLDEIDWHAGVAAGFCPVVHGGEPPRLNQRYGTGRDREAGYSEAEVAEREADRVRLGERDYQPRGLFLKFNRRVTDPNGTAAVVRRGVLLLDPKISDFAGGL
jgi:hypothetical protein